MPDERWGDIYTAPLRDLRGVGGTRHDTPRVLAPTCPEHCTGHHETEATFSCPQGHGAMYRLVAHEWLYTEGHFFYSREAMSGAPALGPRDPIPACQSCGKALVRR